MQNISTKTGDKGLTSLIGSERLSKASPPIITLGSIDELNSWLGLVLVAMDASLAKQKQILIQSQRTLFLLGATLAGAKMTESQLIILNQSLVQIETASSNLQRLMKPNWLASFVLPGGTELSARLDVARTVCRRAERAVVANQFHLEEMKNSQQIGAQTIKNSNQTQAQTIRHSQQTRVQLIKDFKQAMAWSIKYLNRLSDYLFVLRSYVNKQAQYKEQKFNI